ncbi:MAG: acyltransferase, partial [Dysgonamonadaceae bacterium]|nr:acyltransferase [Dysgonamonadaceae bacterium]
MKKKISQFVLKLMGWKIGNVTPEIPKCVIAVAPHTSNMDFIIGKLAYTAIGRNTNFLIKKGWFVFPFNIFFNSI